MEIYSIPVQLRWSDLDPNFHIRHSVYYDWGAMCRIKFLDSHGLTPAFMSQHNFGPIILREECVFRKEIKYGDELLITLKLIKGKRDYSRWTITHEIKKNDNILCSLITIDGAWINSIERKLFKPSAKVEEVFSQMPIDENFQWLD